MLNKKHPALKKYLLVSGLISALVFLAAGDHAHARAWNYTINPDSSENIRTIRARLGTSPFYVQKPEDCIENIYSENAATHSGYYFIEARKRKPNTVNGRCSFILDKQYVPRLQVHPGETSFTDSVCGKIVTVKEYTNTITLSNQPKVTELVREFQLNVSGTFIWIVCSGANQDELAKYYRVAKSLSFN
jgi:hypothetical protein